MTTHFTASNGIEIEISEHGYLLGKGDYGSGPTYATAGPEGIDALREYFQHERDTELGRWRSKEHPNYVVYPVAEWPDAIDIMDESTTTSHRCAPGCFHPEVETFKWGAVKAEYFAAHPARQPWYDAQSGELWILTIDGEQVGALAWRTPAGPQFETATGTIRHDDPDITGGRRIWPTGDDDE